MRLSNREREELVEAIMEEMIALDEVSYKQAMDAARRGRNLVGKKVAIGKWHAGRGYEAGREKLVTSAEAVRRGMAGARDASIRAKNRAGKKVAIGKWHVGRGYEAGRDASIRAGKATSAHVKKYGVEYTAGGVGLGAGGAAVIAARKRR